MEQQSPSCGASWFALTVFVRVFGEAGKHYNNSQAEKKREQCASTCVGSCRFLTNCDERCQCASLCSGFALHLCSPAPGFCTPLCFPLGETAKNFTQRLVRLPPNHLEMLQILADGIGDIPRGLY